MGGVPLVLLYIDVWGAFSSAQGTEVVFQYSDVNNSYSFSTFSIFLLNYLCGSRSFSYDRVLPQLSTGTTTTCDREDAKYSNAMGLYVPFGTDSACLGILPNRQSLPQNPILPVHHANHPIQLHDVVAQHLTSSCEEQDENHNGQPAESPRKIISRHNQIATDPTNNYYSSSTLAASA